jgi:hypothetical protein
LPVDTAPVITSERSPFATTSTVPPYVDIPPATSANTDAAGESEFATWNTPPAEEPTPGLSWNSGPPPNTSIPVSDDMIAALVGGPEVGSDEASDEPRESPESAPVYQSGGDSFASVGNHTHHSSPSIDHLLKLVRDLEYGLVELADGPPVSGSGDTRLLANALADLQDEDDLTPLRNAVATAQDRPRDVDVMLDLVLRADAIASLVTERDQLKSAISIFLEDRSGSAVSDESTAEPDVDNEAPDDAYFDATKDVEAVQESSEDEAQDTSDDSQAI